MKKVSRRLIISSVLPAAVLGVALPARAGQSDQPHMQSALDALKNAERELHQATSDKGGHRVKAERLVRQAITEVESGMRFDRRH